MDDLNIVQYNLAHSIEVKTMIHEMLQWDPVQRACCPSGLTPLSSKLVSLQPQKDTANTQAQGGTAVALKGKPIAPPLQHTATPEAQTGSAGGEPVIRPQKDQETEEGTPRWKRIKVKGGRLGIEIQSRFPAGGVKDTTTSLFTSVTSQLASLTSQLTACYMHSAGPS